MEGLQLESVIYIYIYANRIEDKKIRLIVEMIESLACLKDWEDGCMKLQTWEDDLKVLLDNLDINKDKDVQKIDENEESR